MIDPTQCAHPMAYVVPDPDQVGKSRCLKCGQTGRIWTRGASGLLRPKNEILNGVKRR